MEPESSDSRRRLSIAMIVRDEEAVLRDTIESVRPIADDIFVLDTGSIDGTVNLAAELGAKVDTVPWDDDFAGVRNLLLHEITGDWILWIDAGERLSEESAAEIRRFVDSEAETSKVYMLMVVVPSAKPGVSDEQIVVIRLTPRHAELRFEGRLAETLEPSMTALGMGVDMAPGQIVRHPRQQKPQRKVLRARRNLGLIDLETKAGEIPARLLIAKGEAHADLGDVTAAREAFRQAIDTSPPESSEMLEAYYGLLTTYDGNEALADEQLTVALEALEVYPLDAQLLCAMGGYLQNRGRLDLAERSFDTAVKYGQVDLATWHLSEIAEMASVCLGLSRQLLGKNEEALEVLKEAIDRYPESDRVGQCLLDLLIKLGRTDEAVGLAGSMRTAENIESFVNAVRGACKATGQEWLEALGYLQSAYAAGCRDPLCLRWLTVTYLSNGQTEPGETVLEEWLQAEPNNVEARAYAAAIIEKSLAKDLLPVDTVVKSDQTRNIRVDGAMSVHNVDVPRMPILDEFTFSADTLSQSES
jgi:tetratricopeptide (TPR) repeat protein